MSLNFRVFIKAVRMIFLNFHNNKLYYILFLSIKKQQKPTWLGKIQSHFRVVVNSLVGRSVRRISLFSLWKEKKQCQWCLVLPFVISGRVLCYIIICTFLYVWNRSKLKVKIKRNWTGIMNKKKKENWGIWMAIEVLCQQHLVYFQIWFWLHLRKTVSLTELRIMRVCK